MLARTRRRVQTTATASNRHDENVETFPRISTPSRLVSQQAPISSLPPSSPPSISSHDKVYTTSPIAEDPFGFFAAERKLKARNARKVLQPRAAQNQATDVLAAMGIKKSPRIDSAESGGTESVGREAFATPIRITDLQSIPSSAAAETPTAQPPRVATPRRRRKKTWLSTRPSSSAFSSVPQSPSPRKSISQPASTRAGVRIKGKTAGNRPKASRNADETLPEEDPVIATKNSRAPLPYRSTRRAPASGKSNPAKMTRKRGTVGRPKRKGGVTKPRPAEPEDGKLVGEREGESFVLDGEEREV
ncbi:hypothetical protein EW145_g4820 [Phellinidium pouzarii]|uniref:Uncharacterized protein n=1 Tax=Phellinidium pouzarii TaxID=167371 RepID=A0A4S4L410_9AGAM|nr:hypothetical protein EW145_g4820 [Phellinidium pouzarii]